MVACLYEMFPLFHFILTLPCSGSEHLKVFEMFLWLQCCCCCCCCCIVIQPQPQSVLRAEAAVRTAGGHTAGHVLLADLTFILKLRTLVQIARDPVIFKRQRHCDETEIEDEHGHSQDLAHLPAGHQDREENKKKHWKQKNNGAPHSFAGHLDRVTKCKSI